MGLPAFLIVFVAGVWLGNDARRAALLAAIATAKDHGLPVPRYGGLALVLAFLGVELVAMIFSVSAFEKPRLRRKDCRSSSSRATI